MVCNFLHHLAKILTIVIVTLECETGADRRTEVNEDGNDEDDALLYNRE